MGCLDSKMDAKRKALADDWTGGEYAFKVGSVADFKAFCPLDTIALKFCGGDAKELKDGIGELTDAKLAEDKAKELGDKIFEALKKLHADFKKSESESGKAFGKYEHKEAFKQIDDAVKFWCEKSGFEHKLEEAKAPEGMEAEADKDKEADGGMNDGGEADEKKEEGAATAPKRETPETSAFGDIAEKVEIPKLLLAMYVCFPAFGDAVKAQVLDYDFDGSGNNDLAAAATLIGAYADAQEKAEGESWGCAWCTDADLEDLKAASAADAKQALVFPGTVVAWADQDTAVGNAGEGSGKKKVIFKFSGKHFKPAGDKAVVFHRQFATISKLEEKDGVTTVELADFADAVFKTVAEWKGKVDEIAKGVGAAVEAGKEAAADADKPKEDDAEKPGE